MLFQGRTASTTQQFQNMIDIIERSGGSIGEEDIGVEKMILGNKNKASISEAELIDLKEEINKQGQSMAVAFLLGVDRLQYGKLVENMEIDNQQGHNNYPITASAANHLLINRKHDP